MASSTSNLDLISSSQASKEVTANALFDASSVSTLFGRRASTTTALTWGYYGGVVVVGNTPTAVANDTLALTASLVNYIEYNPGTGALVTNTSGWSTASLGYARVYAVTCGASTITSYVDWRFQGIGAPIAQYPMVYISTWNASTNTPTLAAGTGTKGYFYKVSTGGTQDLGNGSTVFTSNDSVVYNGATWDIIQGGITAGEINTALGYTLSGTAAQTYTLPTTTATVARTDAGQTFTGVQAMTSPAITTNITTPSASFDAFNTTATTVNAFGAATTLNIGAATGTATINNAAVKLTSAGTVSAPSFYLSTDTTTGLYRIGANNLGVAVSGAKVLDVSSTGLAITGIQTISNASTNSGNTGVYISNSITASANGGYPNYGCDYRVKCSISTGVTNSSNMIGVNALALRNYVLTGDTGTLSGILYGQLVQYGHFNTDASTPITGTAYGMHIMPYRASGTITNMYDMYLAADTTGGAVTYRWGIYQAQANNNVLYGNTRFGGVTAPVATVDVTGGIAYTTTMSAAAGTVSAPSFYLSTDTTTGLYRIGANNLGVAVSGAKVLDVSSTGLGVVGNIFLKQAAPTAETTTATTTAAKILNGLVTCSGTAYTLTLDTGTAMDTAVPAWATDTAVDWSIISTASGTITLAASSQHTIVGTTTTTTLLSSQWRTRRTAPATYVTYRIS